jgi:GNAT superfamily N-acetyltransferase
MLQIRTIITAADIFFCRRALLTFRPELHAATLETRTLEMMNEGFRIICIANETGTEAAAIAGFRSFEMYRTGRIIYVDDLFTFPESRRRGYGGALLDHMHFLASEAGIKTVYLDSGYDPYPAHQFYLNKGFVLSNNHFAKTIAPDSY